MEWNIQSVLGSAVVEADVQKGCKAFDVCEGGVVSAASGSFSGSGISRRVNYFTFNLLDELLS